MSDSQDIETVTTALQAPQVGQPDSKTRRYDRQLRLWAATGQSSLESSRVLLLSGDATSTSILKNLVLPGIGHYTILDPNVVTPEDAGNNFFLEGFDSIGKSRAEEAVRLLGELNDSVEGHADRSDLSEILSKNPSYLTSFSVIIAHNLTPQLLEQLSNILWSNVSFPPLIVVRSAGFAAEFFVQFHEHTIIDAHPETPPSLRIQMPIPALLEHSLKLDLEHMDITDHGHIPYVVILVRVLEDWKASHGGQPPKTYAEQKEFKKNINALKRKPDEENFEEAVSQAYRAWKETHVPAEISALFQDPGLASLQPNSPPFFHLLSALKKFTEQPPYTLPLSSTLPDMKSDTTQYVGLQKIYKARAEEEKESFRAILKESGAMIPDALVDEFVKNSHGIKILHGAKWGSLDASPSALANALLNAPKDAAIHLALSALSSFQATHAIGNPSEEDLHSAIVALVGKDVELPSEVKDAVGEVARAPTADLPNMAAFMGGLVAQEAIKLITKQYVPVNGVCVVDLVGSTTGVIGV